MPVQTNQTKWGNALRRVLAHYPPSSPGFFPAVETVIKTAMEDAFTQGKSEGQEAECFGHHDGIGRGAVCRSCYDALEMGKVDLGEEVAPLKETKEDKESRSAIEQQVAHLLRMDIESEE